MREQDGKFTLFDIADFISWLKETSFSRVIKLLQVHHTFQPSYAHFYPSRNHLALLHNMEHFHVVERGFSEIAQNVTTFPDGLIAICRPLDHIPAGIKGANRYGICVENLGNFDANGDVMTPEHRDCVIKVFAHLCRRFQLKPNSNTIQYHHWWDLDTGRRTDGTGTTKTCPGTDFFSGNSVSNAETNFIPRVTEDWAAIPSPVPLTCSEPAYTAEVCTDRLNVRTLPSRSGAILKTLGRGVEVGVYEDRNGWSRIDPLKSCWVESCFLRTPDPDAKSTGANAAHVATDLLNVRSQPSLGGMIIQRLHRGQRVYVYEECEDWSRIDETKSLWVCRKYLEKVSSAAF